MLLRTARAALPIGFACALLKIVASASAGQRGPEEGDEARGIQSPAPGGSLACSFAARERYIEDARAAGISVEGEGDDVDVIARSEEQKVVLEQLYLKQLDDLAACQEG
ncbi:MAG: hypothetical protein AAGA26_05045 [Pseudomonadota bacterium]